MGDGGRKKVAPTTAKKANMRTEKYGQCAAHGFSSTEMRPHGKMDDGRNYRSSCTGFFCNHPAKRTLAVKL